MKILSILEEKVVTSIAEFLEGDLTLLVKGKTIKFKADDGLFLYSPKRRCGSQKTAGRDNSAKTAKFLWS